MGEFEQHVRFQILRYLKIFRAEQTDEYILLVLGHTWTAFKGTTSP